MHLPIADDKAFAGRVDHRGMKGQQVWINPALYLVSTYAVRMILPILSPASIMACAFQASASGNVACTMGRIFPASRSGHARSRSFFAISPLKLTGRGRKVEPVMVRRRRMT